jgi:hypothetical protein
MPSFFDFSEESCLSAVEGPFIACFTHPMIFVVDEKNVESLTFLRPCLVPPSLSWIVPLVCNDSEALDVDRL